MLVRVGIIGITGYTGSELLRLLYAHDDVELTYVTAHTFAGKTLSEVYPHYLKVTDAVCRPFSVEEAVQKTDLVFAALPHGMSMGVVPQLYEAGLKVIDLSADFRLENDRLYNQWYKREHIAPQYLEKAVYGMPELYREEIKKASLVANPGCYPTSVILPLAPLAVKGLIKWETLIVDSKSGASGAGRSPSQGLHFPECTENFRAYKVADHQHTAEMEQELSKLAGERVVFTFVPHLLPMIRGILSTIYLELSEELSEEEVGAIYSDFYNEEFFIRLLPASSYPETKYVYGSNYCDIFLKYDARANRMIIVSAIDNLVKGAAGQAVQNMNIMLGFAEDKGLRIVPLRP